MTKLICISIVLFSISVAFSQESQQWRGKDRKGIYPDTTLLKKWTADDPKMLWSNDNIGNGYGSPIITVDNIYIQGEIDSIGYLFKIDLKGNIIWKSTYGYEWIKTFPGSRSTPTLVENLIYVSSGLGNIYCFDATTGQKQWSLDMQTDFHGRSTYHGHSESILVLDNDLFFVLGGVDTNIVSLNRFNGEINWVCKGRGEIPGYNSPILINLNNRKIVVTFTAYCMFGIDAMSGKILWTHEQDNIPLDKRQLGNGDTHSNSAYYENGFIYYIAGDGNCAVKLKLSADGSEVTQVWRNKNIDNFMGGFILKDNVIYSCTNSFQNLVSINADSGEIIDSLKIGIGALISDGSLLYYYNQKGETYLINPNKGKMEVAGQFKVTKGSREHFSHPVIDKGVLYIRHGKSLMAYDIKGNS